ncbi:hypothetical protein GFL96_26225 [Rhizobium leguminosarum bv. viciae]|nr:hypothetical protein [Rhizobium leguminosarum bv. viciae]
MMRQSTAPTENFAPRFGRLGARIAKANQIKIARPKGGPSNQRMISIAPFQEDADPIVHVPRADRQICFVGRRCAFTNSKTGWAVRQWQRSPYILKLR